MFRHQGTLHYDDMTKFSIIVNINLIFPLRDMCGTFIWSLTTFYSLPTLIYIFDNVLGKEPFDLSCGLTAHKWIELLNGQVRYLTNIFRFQHNVFDVLGRYARHRRQHLLRLRVEG